MTRTIWRSLIATVPATLVSLCATAWLASRFGAVGCVIGVVIQSASALAISIVLSSRAIPLRLHRVDLGRVGLMCACLAVSVTLALAATASLPAAVQLAAGMAAGCISYGVAGWVLMRNLVDELMPRRWARGTEAGASGAGG